MVFEPKIYALVVTSEKGQVLHLGVHFSLEEAYAAARKRMESLVSHTVGEAMDIELWNTLPAREVLTQFTDPMYAADIVPLPEGTPKKPVDTTINEGEAISMELGPTGLPLLLEKLINESTIGPSEKDTSTLHDHIKDLKKSKNHLMQKLISEGDITAVERVKGLLGNNSRKYIIDAILKKNKSTEGGSK